MKANFFGSLTQSATVHVGYQMNQKSKGDKLNFHGTLEDVHVPVKELLPMVDPLSFEISGWDISGANLYEACKRARVLEPDLLN